MESISNALLTLDLLAKAGLGLWLWSVWSWRLRLETPYRGGGAKNLFEEFQTYGYPVWVFKLVGAVKLSCASMLVVSIIHPCRNMTLVGACGITFLMGVALASHVKVQDDLSKSMPAFSMLSMSTYILGYTLSASVKSEPSLEEAPSRVALGIVVFVVCFYMWFCSFQRGDYNFDNYVNVDSTGLLNA